MTATVIGFDGDAKTLTVRLSDWPACFRPAIGEACEVTSGAVDCLRIRVNVLEATVADLETALALQEAIARDASAQIDALTAEVAILRDQVVSAECAAATLKRDRDGWEKDFGTLARERDALAARVKVLSREREELARDFNSLASGGAA